MSRSRGVLPARRTPALARVDTTTGVLAVLTTLAFVVAGVFRLLSGLALSAAGQSARYVSGPVDSSIGRSDLLASISVVAVGAAVLLLAGTVVSMSLRNDGRRLPLALASVVAGLALVAAAAGLASASSNDWTVAVDAATLRTALAGIAAACLPGVVIGALRMRRR